MSVSKIRTSTLWLRGVAPIAIVATLAASAVRAADAPAASAAADAEPMAEVVVTGSLLQRTKTESPSPVTVLTSDSLTKAGITDINEAVRSISADGAGSISTGFQNGFSAGGAAVSLRGLGVSSTLVLIDGQRSANFPLNDDGHNAYVDLNSIPFSAVERIEVLKDGASSTYGADAIGGVVNIIMKKRFTGVAGRAEGGISQHGDAGHQRVELTAGFGDYEATGFNAYLTAEYQHDGTISAHSRGFPFNTADLSAIGGVDANSADDTLPVNTPHALVTRVHQNDLNNPLSGQAGAPLTNQYVSLNLDCPDGTYTVASGAAQGTACKQNLTDQFSQIQPKQERYSLSGRVSFRVSDTTEAYLSASWAHNAVHIKGASAVSRYPQPFGASPTLSSSNPGVVLPVYVCAAGTNCATAADRKLNPNNPFATAYADDPSNGAARLYYMFGDIPFNATRTNDVYRLSANLSGSIGETWRWQVQGVYARDNFDLKQNGYINVQGLLSAINTGAYNFVDPSRNSDAVREAISPTRDTKSYSTVAAADASISTEVVDLPGGPLQVAVGAQVRREVLLNRNANEALDTYNLTTSNARGRHTVSAAYFELSAPIAKSLELDASGRYDHYSEGYSRFSPKIGAKFTPIRQLALRGTYSQGFRAPTFAESNPASSFAGFSTYTPPCNFVLAHGGTGTLDSCSANGNPYALSYSLGQALQGNPELKPEKSRSFTFGTIVEPARWLSFTVDYYNVKKTDIIVTGALANEAKAAYFAGTAMPAGYSVNLVDAVDPRFPNALPRVLIINAPYTNGAAAITSGIDFAATARIPLASGVRWTSRVETTDILTYNFRPSAGAAVQKFVGTMGPYELSSGAGTPKWRANWQNTLELGRFALTATTYYVGRIKNVAADENAPGPDGKIDLSCDQNLYGTGDKFCRIKSFIYTDLNAQFDVNDNFTVFANVGNAFNRRAPIAPSSYSGINYLPTWHYAGVIGRTFRAGASFRF